MLKKIMSAIDETDEGTIFSLCAAFAIAIIMRLMTYRSVFVNNDVVLIGADPYYHLRRVLYMVQHFPETLQFDPFINYPNGLWVGWPPLYDQLTALFAIVIGLGNPDIRTITVVCAYFPVIISAFTVFLVFLIARRIFDDDGDDNDNDKRGNQNNTTIGLVAAFMFAIMPAHVTRSVLGFADHDAFQTLVSTLIFLLFLVAIRYATQSGDEYKDVKGAIKGVISNKRTLAASVVFGASMAAGMYTWLGAPIFIAIVAVYGFIQWIINCRYDRDSTPLVSVCIIGSATALLLMLPVMAGRFGMEFTMNYLSLFHTTFVGLFFMLWIGVWGVSHMEDIRYQKRHTWYIKPIAVVFIGIVFLVMMFIAVPEFYQTAQMASGFMTKQTATTSTIQETASLFYMDGNLSSEYVKGYFSTSFVAFIVGMLILIRGYITKSGKGRGENVMFLIVWSLCTLLLSALQIRFTNFFAVNVAILSGYTITTFGHYMQGIWAKRSNIQNIQNKKIIMQILTGVVVLGIVIPTTSAALALTNNPLTPAKTDWYVSLQWLEANTPPVSDDNPEYSVLSWWSFGNWIMQVGGRPVVANNFQTGVVDAALFFTSSNVSVAEQILKDHRVRYIITDYYMGYVAQNGKVYGKFHDMKMISGSDEIYYTYNYDYTGRAVVAFTPQYYDTMFAQLALGEGRWLDNFTLVYRSPRTTMESENTVSQIMIFEYFPH